MDEVLEMLDKMAKRVQQVFDGSKEVAARQTAVYEQTLQSKETSEAQKVKAFVGRAIELDRLERLSSQLSLLYILQIFAFKVKVLEVAVDNINERLARSGILEKHMEIEGIKRNIEALKILIDAQYESLKDIREKQNKDLQYIF